jgi:hypothetical protein
MNSTHVLFVGFFFLNVLDESPSYSFSSRFVNVQSHTESSVLTDDENKSKQPPLLQHTFEQKSSTTVTPFLSEHNSHSASPLSKNSKPQLILSNNHVLFISFLTSFFSVQLFKNMFVLE